MNTVGIGDVVRYRYEVGDISSGQLATIVDDYGLGSYLVEVASGRRYYATAHEFDLCSEHMATITERLRRDTEAPMVNGQSFDIALFVPLRELRHEAADVIDALVAALGFYANPIRYNGPNQRNDGSDPFSTGSYIQSTERDQCAVARAALAAARK